MNFSSTYKFHNQHLLTCMHTCMPIIANATFNTFNALRSHVAPWPHVYRRCHIVILELWAALLTLIYIQSRFLWPILFPALLYFVRIRRANCVKSNMTKRGIEFSILKYAIFYHNSLIYYTSIPKKIIGK
jgi:hypothetical protein